MIEYVLVRVLVFLLGYLPFCILYRVSDLLSMLFYVAGIRKKTIYQNIQQAFPLKTNAEIKYLVKGVYRNFFDVMFVELLKGFTISSQAIKKRYVLQKDEGSLAYLNTQGNVILVMGHFANWEWGASLQSEHVKKAFYKPLKNPLLNAYVRNNRARFGVELVSVRHSASVFLRNRHELSTVVLIADKQNIKERDINKAVWLPFLNGESPFLVGPAKSAQMLNSPLFFVTVKRIKRGYYQVYGKLICQDPNELDVLEITRRWVCCLEAEVLQDPSSWFWFWATTRSRQCR